MMLISWWCTFPNAFFKSFEVTMKDFCFVLVWLIACIRLSRCSKVPDIPIMKLFCVPLLMEPFLIKNEYKQLQMHEVITFSIISFSAIGLKSLFIMRAMIIILVTAATIITIMIIITIKIIRLKI